MIDAVKKGAAQNENWHKLYEKAGYAATFAISALAIIVLAAVWTGFIMIS